MLDPVRAAQEHWTNLSTEDPAFADAVASAMKRCGHVAETLGARLQRMGFPVHPVRQPPLPDIDDRIATLERLSAGPLPPQLVAFWKVVGQLRFMESTDYAHVRFWSERGTNGLTGAVVVAGLDDGDLEYLSDEIADWKEDEDEDPFEIPLAPDDLHKDNISGGSPFVMTATSRWDEQFHFDGWNASTQTGVANCDLVSYLRTALLECGGFPGLRGDPAFERVRADLVAGLEVF